MLYISVVPWLTLWTQLREGFKCWPCWLCWDPVNKSIEEVPPAAQVACVEGNGHTMFPVGSLLRPEMNFLIDQNTVILMSFFCDVKLLILWLTSEYWWLLTFPHLDVYMSIGTCPFFIEVTHFATYSWGSYFQNLFLYFLTSLREALQFVEYALPCRAIASILFSIYFPLNYSLSHILYSPPRPQFDWFSSSLSKVCTSGITNHQSHGTNTKKKIFQVLGIYFSV